VSGGESGAEAHLALAGRGVPLRVGMEPSIASSHRFDQVLDVVSRAGVSLSAHWLLLSSGGNARPNRRHKHPVLLLR